MFSLKQRQNRAQLAKSRTQYTHKNVKTMCYAKKSTFLGQLN